MACADVSIAPGPIETFCLAALESLASGTPVVASATSAVGEFLMLDSKNPVGAVAENKPEAFADAIRKGLDNKEFSSRLTPTVPSSGGELSLELYPHDDVATPWCWSRSNCPSTKIASCLNGKSYHFHGFG